MDVKTKLQKRLTNFRVKILVYENKVNNSNGCEKLKFLVCIDKIKKLSNKIKVLSGLIVKESA